MENQANRYEVIKKQFWRMKVVFSVFDWKDRKQAYVECKIKRKVPNPRGWFEMKEFTFNWNSLHTESGNAKNFKELPKYDNPYSHPFIEIFKDFWIEPLEHYKPFYL